MKFGPSSGESAKLPLIRSGDEGFRLLKHMIFVRVNVRHKLGLNVQRGFVEAKLDAMSRWLFPSLVNQTCQEFMTVLFCDIRSPQVIKDMICDTVDKFELQSVLVFMDERLDWQSCRSWVCQELYAENEALARRRIAEPDVLMTTRIDADDAVSPRFVELVQSHALQNREAVMQGNVMLMVPDSGIDIDVNGLSACVPSPNLGWSFATMLEGYSRIDEERLTVFLSPDWSREREAREMGVTVRQYRTASAFAKTFGYCNAVAKGPELPRSPRQQVMTGGRLSEFLLSNFSTQLVDGEFRSKN